VIKKTSNIYWEINKSDLMFSLRAGDAAEKKDREKVLFSGPVDEELVTDLEQLVRDLRPLIKKPDVCDYPGCLEGYIEDFKMVRMPGEPGVFEPEAKLTACPQCNPLGI